MCANAFVYFLCHFINTQSAFTSFSVVLGTLIGFVMGIYIPIGNLPEGVGWVIKCFPMSHAASMFKIAVISDDLKSAFANEAVLTEINKTFGVTFSYGDFTSDFWFSAAVLLFFTIFFFGLSVLVSRVKKQKSN
jgi:multidrug/hemolysin transport system permease protein